MPTEASARLCAKWLTQSRRNVQAELKGTPTWVCLPPSNGRARLLPRSGPYTASKGRCTATRTPERTGRRNVTSTSSPW
eukprot:14250284-Alexandrium_andersonii.AAC.1